MPLPDFIDPSPDRNTLRTERASVADLPLLRALKDACVAQMRAQGIDQWDDVYPSVALFQADLSAGTVQVARGDGALLGAFTLDAKLDPLWADMDWQPPAGPVAAVHRLMVHPAQQGRGLGRQLMARAESLAKQNGACAIRLDAFTANPAALALYAGLGYRRTGGAQMRKGRFVCFEKML